MVLFAPVFLAYLETGRILRLPTAVLAMGLVIIGTVSAVCGLILDSLTRARIEAKRAVYLGFPALSWPGVSGPGVSGREDAGR
jgi:hypothetical protein